MTPSGPYQVTDSCDTDHKGYFLADGNVTEEGLLPAAVDEALAERLWKISEQLVKPFVKEGSLKSAELSATVPGKFNATSY